VRSSVDYVIAACASRHKQTDVYRDRNFERSARIVGLEHIDIAGLKIKTRPTNSEAADRGPYARSLYLQTLRA